MHGSLHTRRRLVDTSGDGQGDAVVTIGGDVKVSRAQRPAAAEPRPHSPRPVNASQAHTMDTTGDGEMDSIALDTVFPPDSASFLLSSPPRTCTWPRQIRAACGHSPATVRALVFAEWRRTGVPEMQQNARHAYVPVPSLADEVDLERTSVDSPGDTPQQG